jgi:TatD DNase family protein
MIFDAHAHYDDERFDPDRDELLSGMPESGVGRIVMPGTSMDGQRRVLEIASGVPFIYAAAGIHPNCGVNPGDLDRLENYLQNAAREKIVAVGECGLDYYPAQGFAQPAREAQREAFDSQISLARRYGLPVIVHDRDAHRDCFDILSAHRGVRAVLHCFSGDAELAREAARLGFYVSFSGSVT